MIFFLLLFEHGEYIINHKTTFSHYISQQYIQLIFKKKNQTRSFTKKKKPIHYHLHKKNYILPNLYTTFTNSYTMIYVCNTFCM